MLGEFATGVRVEPGTYRSGVVDPTLTLVRESGARLLWVSPIPVRDRAKAAFIAELATEWQAALRGRPDATYVDVVPVIAPAGFVAHVRGPDGRPQRVRRSDGIHLCPAGQRLVTTVIVDELAPLLTAPPPPDWDAAWRRTVHEPGGCGPYRPGD